MNQLWFPIWVKKVLIHDMGFLPVVTKSVSSLVSNIEPFWYLYFNGISIYSQYVNMPASLGTFWCQSKKVLISIRTMPRSSQTWQCLTKLLSQLKKDNQNLYDRMCNGQLERTLGGVSVSNINVELEPNISGNWSLLSAHIQDCVIQLRGCTSTPHCQLDKSIITCVPNKP